MIDVIFLHTLILLIWFKTDAFIVYSKLLKVNKYFKINEYENFKNTKDASVSYHLFLRSMYPENFWIKLVTCPICLGIWLCIPTLIILCLSAIPIVIWIKLIVFPMCLTLWLYVFTFVISSLYIIPKVCVISIFLYYLIVKLM